MFPADRVAVIAEVSCSHMGSLERAQDLIRAAKAAGADVVKFQCYEPAEMTYRDHRHAPYRLASGPWKGKSLWRLYEAAQTPHDWMPELFATADREGIAAFSSVFGPRGLAVLEDVGCPAYKIASPEAAWVDFIGQVAGTGKPVIVSLGMTTEEQRRLALQAAGPFGLGMHCVSAYPAPLSAMALHVIDGKHVCGLSDHSDWSVSRQVAMMAVARGAMLIEKHIMLEGTHSLDEPFSLTPAQFRQYVQAVRDAEAAVRGDAQGVAEEASQAFRRRWIVVEPIPQWGALNGNVRALRAASGVLATDTADLLGLVAARDLLPGEPVEPEDVQWLA